MKIREIISAFLPVKTSKTIPKQIRKVELETRELREAYEQENPKWPSEITDVIQASVTLLFMLTNPYYWIKLHKDKMTNRNREDRRDEIEEAYPSELELISQLQKQIAKQAAEIEQLKLNCIPHKTITRDFIHHLTK